MISRRQYIRILWEEISSRTGTAKRDGSRSFPVETNIRNSAVISAQLLIRLPMFLNDGFFSSSSSSSPTKAAAVYVTYIYVCRPQTGWMDELSGWTDERTSEWMILLFLFVKHFWVLVHRLFSFKLVGVFRGCSIIFLCVYLFVFLFYFYFILFFFERFFMVKEKNWIKNICFTSVLLKLLFLVFCVNAYCFYSFFNFTSLCFCQPYCFG